MTTMSEYISSKSILDLLECPVCCHTPALNLVYQCCNGHIICKYCYPRMTTCPICRVPLNGIRSLFTEKLLKRIFKNQCDFTTYGCDLKFNRQRDKESHHLVCNYREVQCPFKDCKEKVSLIHLMDHYKFEMRKRNIEPITAEVMNGCATKIVAVNDTSFTSDWIRSPILFSIGHRDHFFMENGRKNNCWFFWVFYVGTQEESDRFDCEIKVESRNEEFRVKQSCDVVSIDVSINLVPSLNHGLMLTDEEVRMCIDDDNNIIWQATVKQNVKN